MFRTALLTAIAALITSGCAGPPPPPPVALLVQCPDGSRWVNDRCVAIEVACPEGARWDGSKCVGGYAAEQGTPSSAQSIVGDYSGEIALNGKPTNVQTHLSIAGGQITGDYAYGPNSTPGRFSNCQIQERRLSCTWTETGLTGGFRVQFSEDGRAFSGEWDFSDGRPGGTWSGYRSPSIAAGPPPAQGPSSGGVSGVYRGSIGIGNNKGPVVTELDDRGGQVTGVYNYGGSRGQLSRCSFNARRLSCLWTEGALTGAFQVDFAADLRSFSGMWDFTGGRPGGSWTGSR